MSWRKLTETNRKNFSHGNIFRCPGAYPYEKFVDFFLIRYPDSPSGFAFLIGTGQKSGHILIVLPEEAKPLESEKVVGISAKWLLENWNKWVYEIGPEGVSYTRGNYIRDDGLIGPYPYDEE